MTSESRLFQTYRMGTLKLGNRVVLAPMTRARAGASRVPNSLMATYYSQRAGAGLVITEATVISDQANGWVNSPGIHTDEQAHGWRQVVDAVHERGTPIFLQLWHCGRASHSSFHADRSPPVAPSAIPINGEYIHTPEGKQPYETPRALETHELPGIVEDYRRAAERAKDIGFDGVEIHAANGYLLDTFLQSKTNRRTDDYGGGAENRHRLLSEVVVAVSTVWPRDRVGVRLSPNGVYNDMGSTDFREQFLYSAGQLGRHGLAYLHVMDGLAFGFHGVGTPLALSEIRGVYAGTLMGNCGYSQIDGERRIAAGHADLISYGRPFISNPDLVERFRNGWELAPPADIRVWNTDLGPIGYTDFPNYTG